MRRMLICGSPLLFVSVWLGLLTGASTAQISMQFPVERDVGIDGWDNHNGYGGVYDKTLETEEFTNFGALVAQVRGKKGTQHTAIMDWDTDAMNDWIATNTLPGDALSWTFNLYPADAPPDDLQIATIESLNDWVEGNGGTSFTNFNWSEGTGAVTQNFAVTYFQIDENGDPVLDEDKSLPWIDNDVGTGGIDDNQYSVLSRGDSFSQGDPIPDFINSEDLLSLDLADAAFNFTYASVPLDNDLVDALLNDPDNRGIVFGPTNDGSVNSGSNWKFFTREASGLGNQVDLEFPGPVAPFLEVFVTRAAPLLQAGDANQDLEFNQIDIVQVQIAAKYLTGQPAAWGEGDWDGAPGGRPGNPPAGDGMFNQLDIVFALAAGAYLTGPYFPAVLPGGQPDDGQTSVGYDANTGEVWVDAPANTQLTSINMDSVAGIFTGDAAGNLGGSFDNDADNNIFKATFGSSFGSLSFGNVAQPGLMADFIANDLNVVGSLAGGGALGDVDFIYIPLPEPSTHVLVAIGLLGILFRRHAG